MTGVSLCTCAEKRETVIRKWIHYGVKTIVNVGGSCTHKNESPI